MTIKEIKQVINAAEMSWQGHLAVENKLNAVAIKHEKRGRRSSSEQSSPDLFCETWELPGGKFVTQECGDGRIEYSDKPCNREFYNIPM